jgi:hypothetical protein
MLIMIEKFGFIDVPWLVLGQNIMSSRSDVP